MSTLTDNLRRIARIVSQGDIAEGDEASQGGRLMERYTNKIITEGAWRRWLKDPNAHKAVKLGDFAEFVGLNRAKLVGEADIPPEWWVEFEAKHEAGEQLRCDLIAAVAKLDMRNMTDAQHAAVALLIASVGHAPQNVESVAQPVRKAG